MARENKPASKFDRLIDELMEDGVEADDLYGEDGLLKRMKKRMAEWIPEAELTDHPGYEKHAPGDRNRGNSRNGKTTKTLKDDRGELPVDIHRDREGNFDPKLIREYQARWPDSSDKTISVYEREVGTAQDHQDQGRFPHRRGGKETALPGSAQSVPKVDTAAFKLEGRYQPVHHHVRGQSAHHMKQSVTQKT